MDTVILGCTHYPLVRPMLQRMLGRGVTLVTPGAAIARRVECALGRARARLAAEGEGDYRFLCTGDVEGFRALGTRFLQLPLGDGRARGAARRRRCSGCAPMSPRAQRADRAADELRPATIEPGFVAHGDRLGADLLRRDARDLHRLRPGVRAALDGGPGPRLGDRRVRDAPRLDGRPQAARRHQGPRRRPHGRDPAADRPLAARRGRLRGARRAHGLRRLRRAAGRRRHALRVDHRRLRRARARLRRLVEEGKLERLAADRSVAAVSCGIVDGVPLLDLDYPEDSERRGRRQRRHDGRRRARRGAGDRRAHAALARAPRRAARARRRRASRALRGAQAAAVA